LEERHTKLELSSPYCLRWVGYEVLSEVALNAADHVVMRRLTALTNDAKGVVLHDRRAADSAQETLLHATFETEDCNFWRRNLDLDRDLTKSYPWNEDADHG
jgi:hypothetical protein